MAKTAMNMEIISEEIIKPSAPTPYHLKTYKLSLLDQLTLHSYTPILLLYESEILTSSDVLKKSLSETLTKYYPFAGRLQKDGVTVDCGDHGVVFVEAKISGCGLSNFLENPTYETQRLLFPEGFLWKGSCIYESFLAAQVTSFEGGGMAVAVSISHKVADGCTIASFVSDWAAVARGEVTPQPMILARSLPYSDLGYAVPEIVMDKSSTCVSKRYVFDAKMIAGMKRSVAVAGVVENPTKVQVVTSHLYKCAIAAKAGCFRKSTWIQLVNMRPRVMPVVPETSIGNFSWYFTITNTDKRERSLGSLVVDLKEGIKEVCKYGGYNLDLGDWLMDVREYAGNVKELFDDLDVYRCTSFCKRPFYQTDFGWGCPKWVTMADVQVKNTFVLFDTPDGDGIEAMVSLEEDDMRDYLNVFNISDLN